MSEALSTAPAAPARYSTTAKWLHWVIAVLIVGQIAGGLFMHQLEFSDLKIQLYQLHKSFGFVVLALSFYRLYWRLTHPAPALPAHMPGWQQLVAKGTHVAFYALMIGVPVLGWLMVSADPLTERFPTKLFFLVPVPNLPVPVDKDLSDWFTDLHELTAKGTLALLILHIAAGLKHHYKDKDDVLSRMVPGIKPKGLTQ